MRTLLLVLAVCFGTMVQAQKKQYPTIDIPYKKYTLDNGLTLIVHEDHKVPIASFNIWYHVGSKNEKLGKTGFAHLFEHIMFTTTEHWKNFDEVMQTVGGGDNNGTTSEDRTNYFETFTNTGLDRVLWLEADRMGFLLNGLDSAKVNIQRGVVQNEKRQGENQPYSIAWQLTPKNTYPQTHPYSWSAIGSMDDLNAASVEDVKTWFRTYYGPNNAVVCIAGDVKADDVFEKVKKYFSDIPAGPPIAKHTEWIAKMTGRHFQLAQDRVPQARLQKTWNVPGWGTQDLTYLNLLGSVLTNGKSSRLYKRLVYDDQLASDVVFFTDEKEIGGQFFLQADAKPGVSLGKIDTVINEELQKLLTQGITEAEVERAKTDYFVSFVAGIERTGGFGGKSDVLALCETFGGSPDYYKKIQSWIKAATPADIKKAAAKWLSDGEYVLHILPYADFKNTASNLNRNEMPPVPPSPAAAFPPINPFTLANGLKVYFVERHNVPVVAMNLSVNAGFAADETAPGLAALTGEMLTEGTTTKTATQISDALTNLGTQLSAYANLDHSYVYLRTLKTNLDASLDLYADVLLHPSFPQKDFDRVQKEQILSIRQEQANPQQLGERILPALLYGQGHPYSHPGSGTESSVQGIKREDLKNFHQSWFVPNNAALVVVGDISQAELKQKLEQRLNAWKARPVTPKKIDAVALAQKPAVYLIDKPGAEQSVIYAAEIAPSGTDPDFDAIRLMNNILGGTFLSRINMNLREDKHWSYGSWSYLSGSQGPGTFVAYAPVQTDKTKESLQELQKELGQLNAKKPIAADEFKKEQTSAVLSVPGTWETIAGLMRFLTRMVEFNKDNAYASNYTTMLQNFTVADMHKAAAKVVQPEHLTWLIVGDRSKIEADIRALNLGAVKILNAEGKEINAGL